MGHALKLFIFNNSNQCLTNLQFLLEGGGGSRPAISIVIFKRKSGGQFFLGAVFLRWSVGSLPKFSYKHSRDLWKLPCKGKLYRWLARSFGTNIQTNTQIDTLFLYYKDNHLNFLHLEFLVMARLSSFSMVSLTALLLGELPLLSWLGSRAVARQWNRHIITLTSAGCLNLLLNRQSIFSDFLFFFTQAG